jgi:hypothetical protein
MEEHQANTDATGVFSISLGNGVRVGGTASGLTTIDWSKGPFYLNLKVAITPIGGNSNWDYNKEWVDMGTTSFGAVPFALYSASSAKVDDKLNVSDTTTMLKVYAKAIKVQSLETSLASKLTAADTLTMLAPYAKAAYTIDSSFFKTQLATKLSIADSTIYVTPTQLAAKTFDQTPITTAIATKLNIADSTKYVTPTQLAAKTFDQTPITTAIATKLNIADSTKYITPTQLAAKTFDTTSLSSRINLKASTTDVTTAISNEATTARAAELTLTNNVASNTASITSNTTAINSNTASITANTTAINSNTASITANTTAINSNTASITANLTAIGLKLDANKVGVANGVASLNLNGLIPNNQIPAISFQSATVVNGEPAMLALNNAVIGSIAIRTDNSKNFVLSALPASTVGNWIELVSPASVTSVNGNSGPTVNLGVADIPNAESLLNKTTASDLGNTNPSDVLYPSQKAVKTYIDAQTAAAGVLDGSITNAKLAGSITAGKLVGTDISIVGTIATGVWSASTIGLTKGGTGATNAADARTNLGLVIGTNVQAPLTAGTDYLTPTGSAASLTNFPTLNQNTTGNAATATLATNATYATTAGDITSTSNTTLTSLSNLNTVGTITTGTISLTTNIKTTNTLTTGAVTYPNIHGSNGQVLSTTGSGTLTWTTISSTVNASSISGTVAVANGGTGATTLTGYVKGTGTTAMTASANIPVADVTGAAPLASPTFTGTVTTSTINTGALSASSVTTPIYASTPQALTDGATISWNPTLGLNASVTLAGNRTLSFTSTPAAGSYGTLVVTQDATGGRTLTLPSTANKVLGSTSTTTIALSTTANAKDILNFYYDGTNCYWNIGQGYGSASTAQFTLTTTGTGAATLSGTTLNIPSVSSTVNSGSISGTIAVANGGTGNSTATQNFIFAGPATGSTAAAPGFRALVAADIPATAISYGKIQNITAGKLLGSISSSAAAPGEVAIGSGLSLTNGTLAATSSGTVTSVAALTLGTTGNDIASSIANASTTPVISLNIPDASSSARGVVTTGIQTIAGAKTFSGAITAKNYITTVPANITAATTTTLDFSTGNILKVSLGANITTLSVTNATAGTYLLEIIQGGTYTVAFPAAWKWSGGTAPTITATSGKTDIITIVYDGTTYFASAVQNF